MDRRFDGLDVQLARLETNVAQLLERRSELAEIAREFRYVRWGLFCLAVLVLGLVARVVYDWFSVMTLFGGGRLSS